MSRAQWCNNPAIDCIRRPLWRQRHRWQGNNETVSKRMSGVWNPVMWPSGAPCEHGNRNLGPITISEGFLLFWFYFLNFYFVQLPTNALLFHKLSHSSYMFRHYCVILRDFVVSILPRYTNMSNPVVGNKLNSVALVRERTIPTERPPPVGEVSSNFCG